MRTLLSLFFNKRGITSQPIVEHQKVLVNTSIKRTDLAHQDVSATKHEISLFVSSYLRQTYDSITAIYLYGSRAKGTHKPNSDWDFYFVHKGQNDDCGLNFRHPRFLEHYSALNVAAKERFGKQLKLDCMGCTEATFEEMKNDIGSHAQQAYELGQIVYKIDSELTT